MLVLDLSKEWLRHGYTGKERVNNLAPLNLIDTFSLDTFDERSKHHPFMETAFADICSYRAVLHHLYDLLHVP
jgi:hypothetical protein